MGIVKLKQKGNVNEVVVRFLELKKRVSENTFLTYKNHLKSFFNYLNIDIDFLTEDQLSSITIDDIENYILDSELATSTLEQRIGSLKSFFRYASGKGVKVNMDIFNAVPKLPETHNSYGVLSLEEVFKMADIVEQQGRKGLNKKMFVLFALDTCLRKEAILGLTWDQFEVSENQVNLKVIDKGNKEAKKTISMDFYNELKKIDNGKEKVFDLTTRTVQRMMDEAREEMGIDKRRNIAFHSVRKAGITFQYRITGDILQAKKAGGHKDINTTMKYVEAQDYGNVGAYSYNKKVTDFDFSSLTKEELVKIIESSSKDIQIILANKALDN